MTKTNIKKEIELIKNLQSANVKSIKRSAKKIEELKKENKLTKNLK